MTRNFVQSLAENGEKPSFCRGLYIFDALFQIIIISFSVRTGYNKSIINETELVKLKKRAKRRIGVLVVSLVLSAMFLLPAQAAGGVMYVNETFENAKAEFVESGWTLTGETGGASITTGGGALVFTAGGATGTLMARKNITLPSQYVISWRFKMDAAAGGLRVAVYGNGIRLFMTLLPSKISVRTTDGTFIEREAKNETGVWYTYTAVINGTNADITRRTDDGKVETLYTNQPLQTMGGNRIDLFIEGSGDAKVTVDSFRIYTGLNLGNVRYYYGDQPAETLIPGETLTAKADVYYGDFSGAGDMDARFIWGLYNSKQMMMDFNFVPVTISPAGASTLEAQFAIPDTLSDSRVWTELYLWDDEMEPMMDMVSFPDN